MVEEIEKFRLHGIDVNKLLNEKFVSKLSTLENVMATGIILIKTKDNIPTPLIITHQDKEEVEEKILHVESSDQDLLNKVKEIIKEL